jgi:hypothetical protein
VWRFKKIQEASINGLAKDNLSTQSIQYAQRKKEKTGSKLDNIVIFPF